MPAMPSGTVTFLLTDVEASTQAWQDDSAAAAAAVARQEEILAAAVAAHGGCRPVEQGEGDSIVAAFSRATAAVAAAVEAQLALALEPWPTGVPLRVRMALHTGEAEARDGRYAGFTIIRTARLRAVAHGGQTLVSRVTAELVTDALPPDVTLVDLGSHRLRDLTRAEHVFQLVHPKLPAGFPALRSLDRVANNLPAQLTSFIGREGELAQVERLLSSVRLLTLTGAGGCGKTRLAAHAAAAVAESYPAGVWWVELAPLGQGSAVSTAVLSALGLREQPARTALEQLTDRFGEGRALLVIDNCEHLLDPVAALLEPLLVRAPDLSVLTTSREPLGVAGETTWRVPPLEVPGGVGSSTAEALTAFDAVALFVERARQARPNFSVTNDNAPAVAEICARLDGIPLAIELAAARVRMMSPEGIRTGLDNRFRFLTGGSRHGLPRQQTLSASVEWSYDLLTEAERTMLRRLAVFTGGFTLDAAEAVCSGQGIDPWQVLDLLSSLVDKSLVGADEEDRTQTRYRLLETIRQFSWDLLVASGEEEAVRDAHLAGQLQLAAEAEQGFMCDDALTNRQEPEHDNQRAALEWALVRERPDDAITLLVGLAHLWVSRGLSREALVWFQRVFRHDGVALSPLRYRADWAQGFMAVVDGRPDPVLARTAELVDQATAAADRRYVARTLTLHGLITALAGPTVGEKILEEAVSIGDEIEDPCSMHMARGLLIMAAHHRGDHRACARRFEESEALLDATSGQMQALYHGMHGFGQIYSGRFDVARRHGERCAQLAAEVRDPTLAGALACVDIALVDLAEGRIDAAAEVLEGVLREPRASGPTAEDPILLGAWGRVLLARGDLEGARAAIAEGAGHQFVNGGVHGHCLGWHVALLRFEDERSRARAVADELMALGLHQPNPGFQTVALRELAHLARLDGELETADDLAHRALVTCADAGLLPDVAQTLVAVAAVAAAAESWVEATRLFGAADALCDQLGFVLPTWDEPVHDAGLDAVEAALDPETFDAAWAEGQALSAEEAVAYAQRGRGERRRPSSGWASLTPTECQVVDLLTEGLRNIEIAERLFVRPSTVKTHLGHIFAKLGVSTRAELAVLAARRDGTS
jgi:predicted ATPase/class 3 adenylate cyclase/DNA-binding CsgD family transcriptional regulator